MTHSPAAITMYDLARFGAAITLDILRTHPLVLIGETLHENPFYMPPDACLRILHLRQGTTSEAPLNPERNGR